MGDRKKPVVLVVDDTPDNIMLVNEVLKNEYQVKVATDGAKALTVALRTSPDIILLDVMMPVMNGYEACLRLKANERLKDIPILFLSAKSDAEDERKGFALGAVDYLIKPISPVVLSARIKTHLDLKRSRDTLQDQNRFLDEEVRQRTREVTVMQEATIMAMAALAEMRDNETGLHLQRTKLYIKELAEHLKATRQFRDFLNPAIINVIAQSAPLHDIGKIGIPDQILLKPGPLSAEEKKIMQKHTILGRDSILEAERMVGEAETFLSCAREIAYSHHEKWDGSGYPQGLSGEDIPLPARLMAVVDAYDALTSWRIYKEAVSHDRAVSIISSDSGKHFDPHIVKAFLALQDRFKSIAHKKIDQAQSLLAAMQEDVRKIRGE